MANFNQSWWRDNHARVSQVLTTLGNYVHGAGDNHASELYSDGLEATVERLASEFDNSRQVRDAVLECIHDDIYSETNDRMYSPEDFEGADLDVWRDIDQNGIDTDAILEVFGIEIGDQWHNIAEAIDDAWSQD